MKILYFFLFHLTFSSVDGNCSKRLRLSVLSIPSSVGICDLININFIEESRYLKRATSKISIDVCYDFDKNSSKLSCTSQMNCDTLTVDQSDFTCDSSSGYCTYPWQLMSGDFPERSGYRVRISSNNKCQAACSFSNSFSIYADDSPYHFINPYPHSPLCAASADNNRTSWHTGCYETLQYSCTGSKEDCEKQISLKLFQVNSSEENKTTFERDTAGSVAISGSVRSTVWNVPTTVQQGEYFFIIAQNCKRAVRSSVFTISKWPKNVISISVEEVGKEKSIFPCVPTSVSVKSSLLLGEKVAVNLPGGTTSTVVSLDKKTSSQNISFTFPKPDRYIFSARPADPRIQSECVHPATKTIQVLNWTIENSGISFINNIPSIWNTCIEYNVSWSPGNSALQASGPYGIIAMLCPSESSMETDPAWKNCIFLCNDDEKKICKRNSFTYRIGKSIREGKYKIVLLSTVVNGKGESCIPPIEHEITIIPFQTGQKLNIYEKNEDEIVPNDEDTPLILNRCNALPLMWNHTLGFDVDLYWCKDKDCLKNFPIAKEIKHHSYNLFFGDLNSNGNGADIKIGDEIWVWLKASKNEEKCVNSTKRKIIIQEWNKSFEISITKPINMKNIYTCVPFLFEWTSNSKKNEMQKESLSIELIDKSDSTIDILYSGEALNVLPIQLQKMVTPDRYEIRMGLMAAGNENDKLCYMSQKTSVKVEKASLQIINPSSSSSSWHAPCRYHIEWKAPSVREIGSVVVDICSEDRKDCVRMEDARNNDDESMSDSSIEWDVVPTLKPGKYFLRISCLLYPDVLCVDHGLTSIIIEKPEDKCRDKLAVKKIVSIDETISEAEKKAQEVAKEKPFEVGGFVLFTIFSSIFVFTYSCYNTCIRKTDKSVGVRRTNSPMNRRTKHFVSENLDSKDAAERTTSASVQFPLNVERRARLARIITLEREVRVLRYQVETYRGDFPESFIDDDAVPVASAEVVVTSEPLKFDAETKEQAPGKWKGNEEELPNPLDVNK
eukprot:g1370.t1